MVENTEMSVHETHDVFESYDLADEEQIIAEMSGRVTDKYVYTFKQGGQDVTGLSFAGTNWAVREYAKQGEVIRIVGYPHIMVDPMDPDYVIVIVTAQRFAVQRESGKEIALDSTIGVKRQWKFMEKKKYDESGALIGKETVVDPFYLEKATSKAIRNSKQALIPTDIVKKLISRAIDARNGKNVQPRGQQNQQHRQPTGAPQGQVQQGQFAQGQAQARPPVQPPQQPAAPSSSAAAPAGQAAPRPQPASAPAAAPMAGSVPAAQAAAPAPPAVAGPPVQQAPPAVPPPPPPAAPPPAPSGAQEMPKDVMVQKLDAVLKAVYGTQDTAVARQGLQQLTGYPSPADMSVDQIKGLGNVLNSVAKRQSRIQANQIIRNQDNVVIWQGPPPQTAAPAVAPASEAMF